MTHPEVFEPPALREITLRVAKVNGVNLGQGVCLLPTPELILDAANGSMQRGANTYAPPQGVEPLREAIAHRLHTFNKIDCTSDNVLVCAGSTGALEVISDALLQAGDEVVMFRPFYPYHQKMFLRKGVRIRYVELRYPEWDFDFGEFSDALSNKTKLILVNTPHNPTGKVFTRSELQQIGEIAARQNMPVVSDEVYEYIAYDGREHVSMASLPEIRDNVITVGSYSKTFAITGWRIGYLVADPAILGKCRTLSDQIYVCAPTPLQHAVAKGITELPQSYYDSRLAEYADKRGFLFDALSDAGFEALLPQGSYYMLAGTSKRFPGQTSEQVADVLIERAHIGAVPASDFLGNEVKGDPVRSNFLRFCYAVPDETLDRAAHNLKSL